MVRGLNTEDISFFILIGKWREIEFWKKVIKQKYPAEIVFKDTDYCGCLMLLLFIMSPSTQVRSCPRMEKYFAIARIQKMNCYQSIISLKNCFSLSYLAKAF